jgi:hypothetical protein
MNKGRKNSPGQLLHLKEGHARVSVEAEAARVQKMMETRAKKWPNGFKISQESRKKISVKRMGHPGVVHTEKTKQLISKESIKRLRNGTCSKRGVLISTKAGCKLYYQSGYELKAYKILENDPSVVTYSRCLFSIAYRQADGTKHRYLPDIYATYTDGSRVVIEVKAIVFSKDPVNLAKWKAAQLYCNKRNMKFTVWTEAELGIAIQDTGLRLTERYVPCALGEDKKCG